MPGSTTVFSGKPESASPSGRIAVAARAGGGVYVAHEGGYPTTTDVRLWRIADSKSALLGTSKNNHIVSIAADPDGRLWVFWVDRGTSQVFARRSDKTATKFGPPVKVAPPAGQDSAFKLGGNAQSGALDVVVLFGGNAQWHTQFLPGLGITASPAKIKRSKKTAVKFTVTDPDAVKGAKVSAGGKSATTDAGGHATINLGPTKSKSVKATVTKAGYTLGTAKIKTKK
jgi:hypothetical protein